MNMPEWLSEKRDDETDAQYMFRIGTAQRKNQPRQTVRGIYAQITLGAKSAWGGEVVTASSRCSIDNKACAFVGDTVRYPDGTEAKISSGAASTLKDDGQVVAILGSHISNGDHICWTPNAGVAITIFNEEPLPEGFLVEGWSHPKSTSHLHS